MLLLCLTFKALEQETLMSQQSNSRDDSTKHTKVAAKPEATKTEQAAAKATTQATGTTVPENT